VWIAAPNLRPGQLRAAIEGMVEVLGTTHAPWIETIYRVADGSTTTTETWAVEETDTITELERREVRVSCRLPGFGQDGNLLAMAFITSYGALWSLSVSAPDGKTVDMVEQVICDRLEARERWTVYEEAMQKLGLTSQRYPGPDGGASARLEMPERATLAWVWANVSPRLLWGALVFVLALLASVAYVSFRLGRSKLAQDYLDDEARPRPAAPASSR